MSATDRLFFAFFPTAPAAAQTYSVQQDLRVRHGLWGRPLAMERLHVALAHLGDHAGGIPQGLIAKAREAGSRLRAPAFDVTFDRALSFEGRARNRPFVLKGVQGAEGVEAFQRQLAAELTACGLGRFAKPYTPHLTLLYDTAAMSEHPIDPLTWNVTEFRLVHSLLGQARHVSLGHWTLGEGQPELKRTG